MSLDPEPESTTETQDALDPQTDDSGPEVELGDSDKGKGSPFVISINGI